MKNTYQKFILRTVCLLALAAMFAGSAGVAHAAILFQDDTFHDVMSDAIKIGSNDAGLNNTAIQFGANSDPSKNGTITWDIVTNSFSVDHTVDVTGGLSATGNVNLSGATQVRIRESATPATAACSNVGELIMNTTTNKIMVCTATGTPGTWTLDASSNADTLDTLDSTQFLRSDTNTTFTSGTITTNALTTLDVNGNLDASGATRLAIPSGAADPGTCTKGDVFFNTTSNTLKACTATDTWAGAGAQDLEAIYTYDADKTLTTSNGNFTVSPGTGQFSVSGTGVLNFDGSSFTLDTTGTFSVDGVGASNVTTDTGNLTLSTTTSGNVNVTSAGAVNLTSTGANDVAVVSGQNITFDDSHLSSAISLTTAATGIAAAYGTTGLIDALNTLTATTAGDGASNVGLQAGSLTNVTPASNDVQAALVALDAKVGAGSANNGTLSFAPEYPDTVIFRDGSANNGTLSSDYDNTNNEHLYNWVTNNGSLQDIDLRFRFPLPADFTATGDFTGRYMTGTANTANNKVDFSVTNATDLTAGAPTTCGSSAANASATWATATISAATINTGCTGATALTAGDIVQIIVKLYDISGAGTFADAGKVALDYNN
jgi:hypothetical protein